MTEEAVEGIVTYMRSMGYWKPKPSVWAENGITYLEGCPKCGKENYGPAVATGNCAWCGYDANTEEGKK